MHDNLITYMFFFINSLHINLFVYLIDKNYHVTLGVTKTILF